MAKQTSRQRLEQQVKLARFYFFLPIPFTVLNLILGRFGIFFLYSLSVPQYLSIFRARTEAPGIALAAVSIALLGLYLVGWIKSKESKSWMKAGLGLALLDLVLFLLGSLFLFDHPYLDILNLSFHILAAAELFQGVMALSRLESMDDAN